MLARIEPSRRTGYATRFIQEQYRATALSAIGALKRGGRYNPPGIAALYTSLQRSTALREATSLLSDEDPTVPHLMLTVEYDIARLLDLTDADVLHRLRTTRSNLIQRIAIFSPGNAPTQVLGRAAHAAGFQGIIAFSRPETLGTNLIVSPKRFAPETTWSMMSRPGALKNWSWSRGVMSLDFRMGDVSMTDRPGQAKEYGFKIPNADNILDPDPLSKLMYTMDESGPRPLAPNDILRTLDKVTLSEEISFDVRRAYRMALGALAYAYWYYPLYTMAAQQLLRVADYAVDVFMRDRGFERRYGLSQRIVELSRSGIINEGQRSKWDAIRRLRNSATHPNFQETWGIPQAFDVANVVAEAIAALPWQADLRED